MSEVHAQARTTPRTRAEREAVLYVFALAFNKVDGALMDFVKMAREPMPEDIKRFKEGIKPGKCKVNIAADVLVKLGFETELKKFLTKEEREDEIKDSIERLTGVRTEIGNGEE